MFVTVSGKQFNVHPRAYPGRILYTCCATVCGGIIAILPNIISKHCFGIHGDGFSMCVLYYYFEFRPFITFCVLRLAAPQHVDVVLENKTASSDDGWLTFGFFFLNKRKCLLFDFRFYKVENRIDLNKVQKFEH